MKEAASGVAGVKQTETTPPLTDMWTVEPSRTWALRTISISPSPPANDGADERRRAVTSSMVSASVSARMSDAKRAGRLHISSVSGAGDPGTGSARVVAWMTGTSYTDSNFDTAFLSGTAEPMPPGLSPAARASIAVTNDVELQ